MCDRVSEDLRRYDKGVPYDELKIGTTFATIVEPMIANDDLVPELRKVVPATAIHALKRAIRSVSGTTSYSQGTAEQAYGNAVAIMKGALQRLVQAQTATAEVAAENTGPGPLAVASAFPRVEDLLHPAIVTHAVPLFRNGHLRDAVLTGVVAVFDMIRARTGLDLDGKDLVGQAFGMNNGRLIFSEVDSLSGQNDQKGFMMIFEGVYTGVRNVKAHSLTHDLTEVKAIQYLVTLSLLARRVDECKLRA
ncbi:TIGR02391 family protein [Paracidovorax wautersii]|uniref:TIGR02391 family protein n=2 Tax=Paracidovorax wautersii TaxID=1177982 RepID=A0A1I2GXJ7_9BURK|nr:TIGR02391 family protein [Paracidovorax wautersii]